MTMWCPNLKRHDGPLYTALADALSFDVAEGNLLAGTRLPTHRELARQLGVTIGTVTRGYAEARRRGLISGEVGRGTFVRLPPTELEGLQRPEVPDPRVIDLSFNLPALQGPAPHVAQVLATMAREDLSSLLQYQPQPGHPAHRTAGALLLERFGISVEAERLVITSGAQHAMLVAFSVLTQPGDTVVTEEVIYPGMKALARMLGLHLVGIPLDEQGACPGPLEELCLRLKPKAIYLTPTLQNPTARIQSKERREQIADVALRTAIPIVEDDIYGFLVSHAPPPIAALAPAQTWYITSLSKSVAPALRIGYLVPPAGGFKAACAAMMTISHMASPLTAELASRLIQDGLFDEIVQGQRTETRGRQEIAQPHLESHVAPGASPLATHIWVKLPEPWRSEEFAREARTQGVLVSSSEIFAVGRGAAPHAIRVSLGAVPDLRVLERGLSILGSLLRDAPPPALLGV